jgi:hypothetical protein
VEAPAPAVVVEYVVGATGAFRGMSLRKEGEALLPASMAVVPTNGQFDQRRSQVVAGRAPVKTGMGHQDDETTYGECDHTRGNNPVREP